MRQTLENLTKVFIGESQARNRYTYYAKVAQKEGYQQIGAIFLETAEQEKTHAKRLFEHIQELKEKSFRKQGLKSVFASIPSNLFYTRADISLFILKQTRAPLNPYMNFDYNILNSVAKDKVKIATNQNILLGGFSHLILCSPHIYVWGDGATFCMNVLSIATHT